MNNRKLERWIIPLLTVASIGGCYQEDIENTQSTYTVTAIDGYLGKANVSVDVGGDFSCTKYLGQTDSHGRIQVPTEYRENVLCVQAVKGQTVDLSRGIVKRPFQLMTTPGSDTVSPITDLVIKQYKKEKQRSASATIEQSKVQVMERLHELGTFADETELFGDYLKSGNKYLEVVGEVLVDNIEHEDKQLAIIEQVVPLLSEKTPEQLEDFRPVVSVSSTGQFIAVKENHKPTTLTSDLTTVVVEQDQIIAPIETASYFYDTDGDELQYEVIPLNSAPSLSIDQTSGTLSGFDTSTEGRFQYQVFTSDDSGTYSNPISLAYSVVSYSDESGGGDDGGGSDGGSDGGGDPHRPDNCNRPPPPESQIAPYGCGSGGGGGPSPSEIDADKIVNETATDEAAAKAAIDSQVTSAEVSSTQINNELANNETQQNEAQNNATEGGTSNCPVELYSGCKVTKSQDSQHSVLALDRVHRLSQGSGWSLGKGWHTSLDTRLIWGVDIDIQPQIDSQIAVVEQYENLISFINAKIIEIQTKYESRIGYKKSKAKEAVANLIGELTTVRDQYQPILMANKAKLAELQASKAYSDSRRSKTQHSVDPSFATEYEIGVSKVKWIAPNGNRYLFNQSETNGPITAEEGHGYQISTLESGDYQVLTPEGVKYQYTTLGLLHRIETNDGNWVKVTSDSANQPSKITDNFGRTYTLTFAQGRLSKVTDLIGRSITYQYTNGLLTKVIGFDGQVDHYQYQSDLNPLALTEKSDGEGNTATYEYSIVDDKTVVTKQTDPSGNDFTYLYDFPNRTTTVVNRNGTHTSYRYDENNRVVETSFESLGESIQAIYDTKGNLKTQINELDQTTDFEYNAKGQLTKIIDGESRATQFRRDHDGRVIAQINAAGETTEIDYDANGKVSRIDYADGSVHQEVWQNGLLQTRVDPQGNHTQYLYNELGYPTRIEYRGENQSSEQAFVQEMDYDAIGRVLSVSQGGNNQSRDQWRTTHYTYQTDDSRSLDKPTQVTDPLGRTARFQYNTNGQITYQRDVSGVVTEYSYTARQRVATKKVTIPAAQTTAETLPSATEFLYQYQYDAENNLIKATHPNNAQWQYHYDDRNRLIKSQLIGSNVVKTFHYDAAGNRITDTDSTGNQTHYSYYADGQLESVTNPAGNVSTYHYDSAGRIASVYDDARSAALFSVERNARGFVTSRTDANQNRTHLDVDALGQVLALSQANLYQDKTRVSRDWRGNITSQTDAYGYTTSYLRDAHGQWQTSTDALGGKTQRQHDKLGRLIYQLDSKGLETRWEYDQQETQLVVSITETDTLRPLAYKGVQRRSQKVYDLLGRLIAYQDAAQQQWLFAYNQQNLLSHVSAPDGSKTLKQYDSAGRLISETQYASNDQAPRSTYYTYDGEGRIETEQLPHYSLGTVNQYRYNSLGLLESVTLPNGGEYRYFYDSAGRRISATDPLGYTQSWQYDANDNVVSYTDQDGFQWQYEYNADNQITKVFDPENGHGAPTQYQYDAMGRVTTSIDPLGAAQSQQYNPLGHIVVYDDALGFETRFTRDVAGRPVDITDPVGATTSHTFDAFNNVLSITDVDAQTTLFSYDELGRLIEKQNSQGHKDEWAYNYRHQVMQHINAKGQVTQQEYDGFGNLAQIRQNNGATTAYQWNKANKLDSVLLPNGASQQFGYDEQAQLTSFTNELGNTWRYD